MESDGVDCVFLTCFESQLETYRMLLAPSIRIHTADTLEYAEFLLIVTGATIVVSDALFLDGTWEQAAEALQNFHPSVGMVLVLAPEDRETRALASERGLRIFVERPLGLQALRVAIRVAQNLSFERANRLLRSGAK